MDHSVIPNRFCLHHFNQEYKKRAAFFRFAKQERIPETD